MLLDVKVAQSQQIFPTGVVSAQTLQTRQSSSWVEWSNPQQFAQQLQSLLQGDVAKQLQAIKIGLLWSVELIDEFIQQYDRYVRAYHWLPIIFDPVLSASSGLPFATLESRAGADFSASLTRLLRRCYCVTPNAEEWQQLSQLLDSVTLQQVNWLVTSVKTTIEQQIPYRQLQLIKQGKIQQQWQVEQIAAEIRGTGCALSTLLACYLSRHANSSLIEAITQTLNTLQPWLHQSVASPIYQWQDSTTYLLRVGNHSE